jgi:hypothetical protein
MALGSAGTNARSGSFLVRSAANSCGVRLLSELCGRSVLYSTRHASMMPLLLAALYQAGAVVVFGLAVYIAHGMH